MFSMKTVVLMLLAWILLLTADITIILLGCENGFNNLFRIAGTLVGLWGCYQIGKELKEL